MPAGGWGCCRPKAQLACVRAGVGPSPPRPPAASKGLGASRYRSLRQAAFDRAGCSHRERTFPFFRLSVQVATGETFAGGRAFLRLRPLDQPFPQRPSLPLLIPHVQTCPLISTHTTPLPHTPT